MSADVLKGQQYISLETYRKSGEGVRTPVWFAQDGSTVYVWTSGQSGKAKRIRRTSRVKVAPSDMRGEVKSGWLDGDAAVLPEGTPEYDAGNKLMNRKYGLMKRFFELMNRGDRFDRVVLKIVLQ
jgi:uncharacterized protein